MEINKKVLSVASGLALLIIFATPAQSALPSIEVISSKPITSGGKNYFEVSAMMKGAVEGRPYSVGIIVLYPENPSECNGTGIVDLINTTGVIGSYLDFCQVAGSCLPQAPMLIPTLAAGRAYLGDDFIAQKGYLYLALQMDKTAIDIVNDPNSPAQAFLPLPGVTLIPTGSFIGASTDGYQIIADSVELIKNLPLPSSCSVDKTIAFSYSRSGLVLRKIYSDPNIVKPNFDGSIVGDPGGYCYSLSGNPLLPPPFLQPSPAPAAFPPAFESECPVTLQPGSGKVMLVGSELGNQLLFGQNSRDETGELSDYRVYEIAGTAHVPKALLDFSSFGATRQNPANTAPVFRAMMENLRDWITDGVEPPPSAILSGPIGTHPFPYDPLANPPIFASQPLFDLVFPEVMKFVEDFDRDGNGNALGGIRLPELSAPLGTYNGTEENVSVPPFGGFLPTFAFSVASGGTFEPFDSETIRSRYPNHGRYVSAVARAAEYAFEQGWLLEEDKDAYIARAAKCKVGKTKLLTQAELDFCLGL